MATAPKPCHALIVGVSGVAAATALQLSAGGHLTSLSLVYRTRLAEAQALQHALFEKQPTLQVTLHQADVAVDEQVRHAFAQALAAHGPLAYVVNCAGATQRVALHDLEGATDELWQQLYSTNVIGAFHVTRAAGAPGAMPPGGAIINISSVAGRLAQGSSLPYACSKAALDCLTAAMARTLGPRGLRVLGVAPGFIAGQWLEELLGEGYAATRSAYEAALPLRQVCTPEDVAQVVVGLLTSAAMVTGQTVVVDGGMCIAGFSATL